FLGPLRITDKPSSYGDKIRLAFLDYAVSQVRLVNLGYGDYRDRRYTLYPFCQMQQGCRRSSHYRYVGSRRTVHTRRYVEYVDPGVYEALGHLLGFFKFYAVFYIFISVHPEGNRKIESRVFLDCLYNFQREAEAVLKGATVLVLPVVAVGRQKLVNQISMG